MEDMAKGDFYNRNLCESMCSEAILEGGDCKLPEFWKLILIYNM